MPRTMNLMSLHADGMQATPVPAPPPCYRGVTALFVASSRNLHTGGYSAGCRGPVKVHSPGGRRQRPLSIAL
jgi:hypothetical protein